MNPPLSGEGVIIGTSYDAVDISGSNLNPMDMSYDESSKTGRTPEKKYYNIHSDKYSLSSIYVMVESTNESNLGRVHPLRVGHILHKKLMIKNIVEIRSVGKTRVRVQLRSLKDANDLIKNTTLEKEHLRAFIPNHILETKGVIKGVDTFFDDTYILQNIKSTNRVLNMKRFTKKIFREGQNEPVFVKKQMVLLTFEGNILPTEVCIDSVIFPVETYYGKVTQCYKCLHYGHISKQCKSNITLCISCGKIKTEDADHTCTPLDIRCVNCKVGTHKSNSKNCPFFVKQQNIKKIMIDKRITFKEAEGFYENSYSNITISNRFSLFKDNENYNINFPPLLNNKPPALYSQQPRQLNKTVTLPLSQPVASTSNENQHHKKRKHNTSPTPSRMFPFTFGPNTPLPPNYNANDNFNMGNDPDKFINEQNHVVDTFVGFFIKMVEQFKSLEELKNLQVDTLKKSFTDMLKTSAKTNKNGSHN